MVMKFSEQFKELIDEDIPQKMLISVEDRGGYVWKQSKLDGIQEEISYSKNGFIENYCKEY